MAGWLAAAGVAGAGIDYLGSQQANATNMRVAKKQMQFQEHMSNTAHQREVEDLRKAGLNPALSGTGGSGASTPAGSSYTAVAPKVGDGLKNAVSTALDSKRLNQDVKKSDADIKLVEASQATQATQAALNTSNAVTAKANAERITLENAALKAQMPSIAKRAEADLKHAEIDSQYATQDAILRRTGQVTGAVGNVLGMGNFLRAAKGIFNGRGENSTPQRSKGYTKEIYGPQGENRSTEIYRYHND